MSYTLPRQEGKSLISGKTMHKFDELNEYINYNIDKIIISNKSDKEYEYKKIDIRQIVIKSNQLFQITYYSEKQAFQENVELDKLLEIVAQIFPDKLKQINIYIEETEIAFKITKKGKLLKNITKRANLATHKCNTSDARSISGSSHNRKKNYIFSEGEIIEPLIDMGVLTKDGKVVNSMYDKFKQINRFVELVDDVLSKHPSDEINIIDFGCGKSYLTFVLYYYITNKLGKRANIVGLDLKQDVIQKCNRTASKYGYENLTFKLGDINGYKSEFAVDMVVTLHACDTATDYALYNAINWNAKYIFSVPCCQHEINAQIKSDTVKPLMKYGIIKERTSALVTDAMRANLLECSGYKTQVLEFVDIAHSPKNLLIRAVKTNMSNKNKENAIEEVKRMNDFFNIEGTLYKLLMGKKQDGNTTR